MSTVTMTTGPIEAHVTCKCDQIKFSTKSAYPQSRCKHVSCLHESHVYICTGKDCNISLRDFWRLNLGTLKWETVSFHGDAPHHLEGHTLVSCKKLMLLFGGEFGDSLTESSLWIINPDLSYIRKSVLDSGSERPCVRRHHSAIIYNGAMYIYGGYIDMKGSSAEMWRYHVDDEEWELVSPRQQICDTPRGRHGHTAIVYNKHMWLYGGSTDLLPKQDLWSYRFGVNRWERIKCKYGPPALIGHTATVVGTRMFIFGGETSREACNLLWYFCFRTFKWTRIILKEQMPARTFHSALLVTPNNYHDVSVKYSSVPYLQKKISKLNLERPRSSPGVRPVSSVSDTPLQNSGSQDSLPVEKHDSLSASKGRISAGNRTHIEKPNVLKLYASGDEECLRVEPSPSENTADSSPLCPQRMNTSSDYNSIDMLDRNAVNSGLDNPGISKSTEELIHQSSSNHAKTKTVILCDTNRPSAFLRSLSYMTEVEKRKNTFQERAETLVSVIGNSLNSLVSDGDDKLDHFRTKKARLDSELVVEDLEYLDCFPHDIQIPYPRSTGIRSFSCKSAESLLYHSTELETIELENFRKSSNSLMNYSPVTNNYEKCVKYDRERELVQLHGLHKDHIEQVKNRENLTKSGNVCDKLKHDRDHKPWQLETEREECVAETETSFKVNQQQQYDNQTGIYRKNVNSIKAPQHTEPPYILILGGKDSMTVSFGIKPIPMWKLQINTV